eukprot:TRINITY_DN1772_c0_g1_i1.p1 TRINITY_DN1772_c0_g1~~TRINITY_DN1772_c0_g1_i1.p1  ORF type:complete len:210 (-),score=63.53 TRINITY_DN1772_c0_g1_i1:360-968(-)
MEMESVLPHDGNNSKKALTHQVSSTDEDSSYVDGGGLSSNKGLLTGSNRLQLFNGYKAGVLFIVIVIIKLLLFFFVLNDTITTLLLVFLGTLATVLISQGLWMFGGIYLENDKDGNLRIIQETLFAIVRKDVGGETHEKRMTGVAKVKLVSSTFFASRSLSIAFVLESTSTNNHDVEILSVATNFSGDRLTSIINDARRRPT